MKTISQIIGEAQALPGISFDAAKCFEEYLSDEYKTFRNYSANIRQKRP
jgi:hypothetical protein